MYVNVLIGCTDPGRWQTLNATLQKDALDKVQIASQTAHLSDIVMKASQSQPEVLLLEYVGSTAGILRLLAAVREVSPASRALVLHDGITPEQTVELITHGANGDLLKSSEDTLICKAIRAVHHGQIWFSRTALLQVIQHLLGGTPVAALVGDESLTQRETEILRFIGLGLTNKEIARRLGISDNTVKTHLHRVYVKLKLSGRYKAYRAKPLAQAPPMPIKVRSSEPPGARPLAAD